MILNKNNNIYIKLKPIFRAMIVFVLILAIVLIIFNSFEKITLSAINQTNIEFSRQVETLINSYESLVDSLGTQIYYISSTKKLRTSTNIKQNDKVFYLREIWQYTSSSLMIQSIYVYNGKNNYIYTTDYDYRSSNTESFYDTGAVELLNNRNAQNRNSLYRRQLSVKGSTNTPVDVFSYLIYEVDNYGNISDSAVLINLYVDWFRENLLKFSDNSYMIIDTSGKIIASQIENLDSFGKDVFESLKNNNKDGYIVKNYNGEKHLCFYSKPSSNGWRCFKIIHYETILPGLNKIKTLSLGLVIMIFTVIMSILIYQLFKVNIPYHRINMSLKEAYPQNQKHKPDVEFDKLLKYNKTKLKENYLSQLINGEVIETDSPISLPMLLILLEYSANQKLQDWLNLETTNNILLKQGTDSLVLCHVNDDSSLFAATLSHEFMCRCYYSLKEDNKALIQKHYANLLDMQKIKFMYPGQSVFAQTNYISQNTSESFSEQYIQKLIADIRSCDTDIIDVFLNGLNDVRAKWENIYFAINYLNKLLSDKLDEAATSDEDIASLLKQANSWEDVYKHFEPRFIRLNVEYQNKKQQRKEGLAEQVKNRIEYGYMDKNLSTKSIADEMGISPAYMRQRFLEVYNCSVNQYLSDIRLDKLAEMIINTDDSIEKCANHVGIENPKYIYTLFKKKFGLTPSQYKANNQNNIE